MNQNSNDTAPKVLGMKSQNLGQAHVKGYLTDKKIEKYIKLGFYGESKRLEYLELEKKKEARKSGKRVVRKLNIDDLLS